MSGVRLSRRKAPSPPLESPPMTGEDVKKQLSLAAGTEAFQHRDPIYHLNESFRQTFDLIGQQRARGMEPDQGSLFRAFMGEETPGLEGERDREQESPGMTPGGEGSPGVTGDLLHKTRMTTDYEPRDWDPQNRLMDRFADVSFQRGRLSAAILRGQGKMMLFSCLERTVGQEKTRNWKERKLFQSHSSHSLVPRGQESLAIVNKGFTDSAVGLVVDSLKDARVLLNSLTTMAEGGMGQNGVGTLHKQYPFLTDHRERELLDQYQARLTELKGPGHQEEREVLKRAQVKTQAVIQKKDQMKRDFLQVLRRLEHNALEAEKLFSQESFLQEASQVLSRLDTDLPPEDGGEDGDDREEREE